MKRIQKTCKVNETFIVHSKLRPDVKILMKLLQTFGLQSSDYNLASPTTHVLCINFIREWRDLQFNVNSEGQIFLQLFFYSKLLRGNHRRKYFFHVSFFIG